MIADNLIHFFHSLSDLSILYILASLVVAVLIWAESALIIKNGGKLPESSTFTIISIITSSWLIISGVALYFLEFDGVMMTVPIIYGLYSVMGWFKGVKLMENDVPDDPRDIVLPAKYLTYTQGFAVVFAGFCMLLLAQPYLKWAIL